MQYSVPVGQHRAKIAIMESSLNSTLNYSKGNCSWNISVKFQKFMPLYIHAGSELQLPNSNTASEYHITCEVTNGVILHAVVTVLGESIDRVIHNAYVL